MLRRGLSVVFVVVAERQEQDAAIFEAGSQLLVTAAYLYFVMTWKPFVSAPAKYTVCGRKFSFDVYNDFEQFGVYTQLAVQVFALVFAFTGVTMEKGKQNCFKDASSGIADAKLRVLAQIVSLILALMTLGIALVLIHHARRDSAEDFCRLKARRCTAMTWIFIPAYCFAIS